MSDEIINLIRVCDCHKKEVEEHWDRSGLDCYCKVTGEPCGTHIIETISKKKK